MKHVLNLSLCIALLSGSAAFAAPAKKQPRKQAATYEDTTPQRHSDSSSSWLPKPAVVSEGSTLLGARLGLGNITYYGINAEHLFTDNFGAILDVRHGTYTSNFNAIGLGEWKFKVWAVALQASMHADLLKVENLDTYLSAGVGRASVSGTYTAASNVNNGVSITAPDDSSWDFIGYVNARYFFSPNWAVAASLGTGLGVFNFGVDYHF